MCWHDTVAAIKITIIILETCSSLSPTCWDVEYASCVTAQPFPNLFLYRSYPTQPDKIRDPPLLLENCIYLLLPRKLVTERALCLTWFILECAVYELDLTSRSALGYAVVQYLPVALHSTVHSTSTCISLTPYIPSFCGLLYLL